MTQPLKPGHGPDDTPLADVETRLAPASGPKPARITAQLVIGLAAWAFNLSRAGDGLLRRFLPG